MEIDDFYLWEFIPELESNSEIKCPECKEWSLYSEWEKSEIECKDCGSHLAIMCPECEYSFDHIFCDIFKTRIKEK